MKFVAASFVEGPEYIKINDGISDGGRIAMETVRIPNEGHVSALAVSQSMNWGAGNGVSILRGLNMLLL